MACTDKLSDYQISCSPVWGVNCQTLVIWLIRWPQCLGSLPGQCIHQRGQLRGGSPPGVFPGHKPPERLRSTDDYTPQDKINDVVWASLRPRRSFSSHETVCVQHSKTVAFFISSDRLFACFKVPKTLPIHAWFSAQNIEDVTVHLSSSNLWRPRCHGWFTRTRM